MPDYKAILDARVAAGELVLRAPGVYALPKPPPVQTHIPPPAPGPVMRGAPPALRRKANPHKVAICKKLKLKYTPPIIPAAAVRGCEGVRRPPPEPKAPKEAPPVERDAQWGEMQLRAAAAGQRDADKFADSALRMRTKLLALKAQRHKLQRTNKKPLETRKAQQAAGRAPLPWEQLRL
jgi:hypothetical protein